VIISISKREATKKRLVKRLQKLGYEVSLTELETASPAMPLATALHPYRLIY
jgi:hypothetical protein